MTLPALNVDDRTFAQLAGLLRKQIDTTRWLDHNPSDPGIMLLELLAWLGEMILYRMNRVPPAHLDRFLDLLVEPPAAATVRATFTLTPPRPDAFVVPPGIRYATEFRLDSNTGRNRRFVYETIEPVTLPPPDAAEPGAAQTGTGLMRERLPVVDEVLGISTGAADQTFPLRPARSRLGLPSGVPAPVLLDFVYSSTDYAPNPAITVDGVPWELKRYLLTEESRVDPADPAATRHVMVEPWTDRVRFGDNRFGTIPPAGAEIVCTRYQVLQGPDALVSAGDLADDRRLDPVPGLAAGETLAMTHTDAEGGTGFFEAEERIRGGLETLRARFRLVTASDFEQVVMDEFNRYQELAQRDGRVLRAAAVMNHDPSRDPPTAPAHVTVVVLAEMAGVDLAALLSDPSVPLAAKQASVDLAPRFRERLDRFLDGRRLITTHVHPEPPVLTAVSVTATVAVYRERSAERMAAEIEDAIRGFLDIFHGGFDGRGWPLGGAVHRSKLFRLIEEIEGVDHVETLTLSPADSAGDIAINRLALPAAETVAVTVVRL